MIDACAGQCTRKSLNDDRAEGLAPDPAVQTEMNVLPWRA